MAKYLPFLKFSFMCLTIGTYSFTIESNSAKDACVKACENGANCTKMGKYEFCKCLPGTFGDDCGIVPDCIDEVIKCTESSNSVCGYNIELKEAECICDNSNLAYDKNTEACRGTCVLDTDCKNEAKCTTSGSYKFCQCSPGTNGYGCENVEDCDKNKVTCKEDSGATCGYNTTLEKAECLCPDSNKEYDVETEQCRETCALDTGCKNGAKCTTSGSYKFCQCLPGTNGHRCEKVEDCDKNILICEEGSGALCGYNSTLKLAECLCSDSKQEYDLETQECREICDLNFDCKNGAKCTISGSYKFCKCPAGTNGYECGNVVDCDKKMLTCKEGSGALCGYNTTLNKAECLCTDSKEKYDLQTEQCRETCALDADCRNEALCQIIGSYAFCDCPPGTNGHLCEKVTDCDNNKVTCKPGSGAFCGYNTRLKVAECLCSDSKIYDSKTKECRGTCNIDTDCKNEAKCKTIGHYALCECSAGTYGHKCEKVADCENNRTTCKEGSGAMCGYNTNIRAAECLCSGSKKYDTETEECRETCASDVDCSNEAKCKTIGNYAFCKCPSGTSGHRCEKVADCENNKVTCKEDSGATCGYNTTLKKAECLCPDSKQEYDSESEQCRETCTSDVVCSNEARCKTIGNYAFCDCLSGTYGHECKKVEDCDNNKVTCKEGSGATCGYNTQLKAAECLCSDGKKYDTEMEECRASCSSFACHWDGICKNVGNYMFCECTPGTYGDYCEHVTACVQKTLVCGNDSEAICIFNIREKRPECKCYNGLTFDLNLGLCRDTCQKTLSKWRQCQNGASCETVGYYYFCECLNGTSGNYCENVIDCDRNYITCNEESGAICGYNPSLEKAECLCGENLTYDTSTETCRAFTSTIADDISTAKYTVSTFPTSNTETKLPLSTSTVWYHSSSTYGRISTKLNTASSFATKITTDARVTRMPDLTTTALSTFFTTNGLRTRNEISTTTVSYVNKCNVSFAICPKSSTECVPNGNNYYCKCKPGFRLRSGISEEHNKISCIKKKCFCGINSYNCQWSTQDKKICSCYHGYSQMKGYCTDCHCGPHSLLCEFNKKGRKLCGCKSGYYQRNETCSEMCTNDKDCQNGGVCELESNDGYFCQCKSPFKGDGCEINEACEYLSHTCNAIGAICQYIDVLRKGVCVCPPYRYFNNESNTCKDKYKSNASLVIVLSIITGFLIVPTAILVLVFKKFRSKTNIK